jgi:hypothetical protein
MDFDPIPFPLDDPLVLEERQVLGYGGLGEAETFPDVFHIAFLGAESCHYLQSDGVSKDFQYFSLGVKVPAFVELLGSHRTTPFCLRIFIYILFSELVVNKKLLMDDRAQC